ncbi:hypothetical protein DSM106972_028550 [Dulcicalothrix desertica PCC 7102]|uniref:DUF4435 domain-containing protein n=1 Tax=Dulcicalothrix desertica PCC 7102 TaxID=232991 RepID=A0A3S1CQL9_9CYAN|nr:DUF3226 domain-containing protein [Dulcicalothrix desertica]RUT06598.1 hypothetical protein DSM106972_028550 [Dulcicalothrix desertica PCC 7102]TWH50291.1 hypothetical protein CAL7102_04586 [Dulcicalothrix desertica PCC 7102]
MPKASKPPKIKPQQLLVEGKNDRHVIWALCEKHQLPETFSVEVPKEEDYGQGIEAVLAEIPIRLKQENFRTLGIVIDADQDLAARWQSVSSRLNANGYQNIPKAPPLEGWVYTETAATNLPKVGVWLMPDNQLPGMLENFVARLILEDDGLLTKAELFLHDIEQAGLNRYTLIHNPKALIHTWLACQQTPGMPMGQAITSQVLSYNSPLALVFVEWLRRLFY